MRRIQKTLLDGGSGFPVTTPEGVSKKKKSIPVFTMCSIKRESTNESFSIVSFLFSEGVVNKKPVQPLLQETFSMFFSPCIGAAKYFNTKKTNLLSFSKKYGR